MLSYKIEEEEGILLIELAGPIAQKALDALTRDVDSYLKRKGTIRGLIIHTRTFPRWQDLGAFFTDMRFVLAHEQKIRRVASVTDSPLLMAVHGMVRHIFSPEIRHFPYGDLEAARKWIRETG